MTSEIAQGKKAGKHPSPLQVMYSRRDQYEVDGDEAWGNWNQSQEAACSGEAVNRTYLNGGGYRFEPVGGCDQGGGLIKATA
jgi:hypothetical protein